MSLTGNPLAVEQDFDFPPNDPISLLNKWVKIADNIGVNEPRGIVLSTVDRFHRPSSRVVLIKDFDEKGIVFTTSQKSAKGNDLLSNSWAAGTLWWRELIQQINFRGQVLQLSKELSDKFFQERTREAQAVAAISNQSASLIDEENLREKVLKLIKENCKIKRPKSWYAYQLRIESIEFWQGSPDRFHKRLRYDLVDGFWQSQRLQP